MTQHKLTITIASLLLLLFSSLVSAQEPTANTKTAEAARRQKAVELLESLATQVAALQSPGKSRAYWRKHDDVGECRIFCVV